MLMRGVTALFKTDIGRAILNGVLITLFTIWSCYQAYERGVADTKATYEQEEKTAIKGQLDRMGRDIMTAAVVSQITLAKLADYQTEGDQTTYELQQTLAKNSHRRRDCRYPADSLQKLSDARTRAAKAVTGGISGAVPSPAATPAKPQ
ncbi:hypothetical protein [Aggregatibacter kilianii]|uniref:hypothetical protein n=1 Tax=Aggregatibacter kilianii TaxID=2025884 RepID=UPI000D64F055|nr:hypothetical protein [Aggregatibacter kilianii]